jgi:hypothetical protein
MWWRTWWSERRCSSAGTPRASAGGNPPTPAADLKWNQTPLLNDRIYRKWKDRPLRVVLAEFDSTYAAMLDLARSLLEDKLFRKSLYPWMRVWPLSRWIAANTSSHYRWARTRIRKWAVRQASP